VVKEPPKKLGTGGRGSIDWDAFHDIWIHQDSYNTIASFLLSYGLKPDSGRIRAATKDWKEGKEKPLPVMTGKELGEYQPELYEAKVKKVWSMIRTWRAIQAETDYRLTQKLRRMVECQIDTLQNDYDDGKQIKTYDLLNLAKILESIQRIQRLSLGMSTDNVGIEDARRLAEDQAGDTAESDAPIFSVEVTDGGKFKRLRPRRVN